MKREEIKKAVAEARGKFLNGKARQIKTMKLIMDEYTPKKTGAFLKKKRIKAGFTLNEVSGILEGKPSKASLSAIENGIQRINIEVYFGLIKLYDDTE